MKAREGEGSMPPGTSEPFAQWLSPQRPSRGFPSRFWRRRDRMIARARHWVDGEMAGPEIARVLRYGRTLGLI